MDRKPVSHEKSQSYRVISVPNGAWVAQRHVGRIDDNRGTESGWEDISRPTDKGVAIARMNVAAA